MINSIETKLAYILEQSSNPKTKKVVKGLIDIKDEVSEKGLPALVFESLQGLRSEDKVVEKYFIEADNRNALNNLGLRQVVETAKATKLYEINDEVKLLFDSINEDLKGNPEYSIMDSYIPGIKRYLWNKNIRSSFSIMEAKIEKFAAYKMIAEAIDALQNDKNPEFYSDLVEKLDRSFALPENQVKHYIMTTLYEAQDIHPVVTDLIKKLKLIESHQTAGYSNLSKVSSETFVCSFRLSIRNFLSSSVVVSSTIISTMAGILAIGPLRSCPMTENNLSFMEFSSSSCL